MKKVLLIILLWISNSFPQLNQEFSPVVLDFISIVEKKYKEIEFLPAGTKPDLFISSIEIDTIAKKMYRAISLDPAGFDNYIIKSNLDYEDKIKSGIVKISTPNKAQVIKIFFDKISEKYSTTYVRMLRIPYFFKVRIIKTKEDIYKLKDGGIRDITLLNGKIEEIIKGECKYHIGEEINFAFVNHLISGRINNFKEGKIYFIPFRHSDEFPLYVQFLEDSNIAYEIEGEIISVPGDIFRIGEAISWNKFKTQFIKEYIIE